MADQKWQPYEVVAWYVPSKAEEDKGHKAKIVVDPMTVMARSLDEAQKIVIRKTEADEAYGTGRVEVAARPFRP